MSTVELSKTPIGLGRQWTLCSIMVLAAFLICFATGKPFPSLFLSRLTVIQQVLVALGLGAAACLNAWVAYKLAAGRPTAQHTVESYSRLDLRGWNPILLASAAGIGEEILFRGALQSWLGVWISLLLFVLAHAKAYRFNTLNKRVLVQAAGLIVVGLALSAIAHFAGLIPAIIEHIVIDIAGLYTVRSVSARSLTLNSGIDR
ncbi:CPBP family intramembrane metalloprotease [Permianibacter sp. IMCC34836]|uniref:CPBP family intramembrane glutamic endopeptidase n=1 Tax=Permianibacter fluminis TaxID=2738515 RepID=UPI001558195B|nr:CPBP family intramembrane glutamic endopeptidase [Permianibacter fluminis]NQD38586.1 CPBP family intramembrane metalloprotease [Permianibacter fluminis]